MTDQITVPRAAWDATAGALKKIAEGNLGPYAWQADYARIKALAIQALTAANAVSVGQRDRALDSAQVKVMRDALKQIEWSNDSKWQADCAREALATINAISVDSQGDAPKWADVEQRTATAQAVHTAIRKEVPGLGPWSAFDADEAQRIVDAIAPPQATEPQSQICKGVVAAPAVSTLFEQNDASFAAIEDSTDKTAWEATTPGYTRFVSEERYRKFSPKVKLWYKPYKCSSCTEEASLPAFWITPDGQGFRLRFTPPTEPAALGWQEGYLKKERK